MEIYICTYICTYIYGKIQQIRGILITFKSKWREFGIFSESLCVKILIKACRGVSIKMVSKAAKKDFNPSTQWVTHTHTHTHTHTENTDPLVEVTFRLLCFQCCGKAKC